MFAIAGVAFCKMLPTAKSLKILGVPNRLIFAILGSIFCVIVELFLHAAGALAWDYSWFHSGFLTCQTCARKPSPSLLSSVLTLSAWSYLPAY